MRSSSSAVAGTATARAALGSPRSRAALAVVWRTAREGTRPGSPGLGARVRALPGLVRDSATGRWAGPGRGRVAVAAVGLLYLVSPVDAVPEAFLPLLGLLDDAVVAAWVAGSLLTATEDYLDWRGTADGDAGGAGGDPVAPPA
ncbi:YkvA family protein [Kineococcus sp. SYSU DK004]|uniref:YkvA family protein n=1 Tax=Kineococcus sp. SYSU DK004 TaxID=3383125 RepID=UPI003D7D75C4